MPEIQPETNSGYAYMRAEIRALQWIRSAVIETGKIKPLPPAADPQRIHQMVSRYTAFQTAADDYTCATSILTKYKESPDGSIRGSVDNFLAVIGTTQELNGHLLAMLESIEKASKPEDINQEEIAKHLAAIKSLQKDVLGLAMMATKLSTFAILRGEGGDDNWKPVAFTITATQRTTLIAEAQRLIDKLTYVDGCVDILLGALRRQLPVADSTPKKAVN
jgi:hypothetical protein